MSNYIIKQFGSDDVDITITQEQYNVLSDAINQHKFIQVGDELLNVANIKSIVKSHTREPDLFQLPDGKNPVSQETLDKFREDMRARGFVK